MKLTINSKSYTAKIDFAAIDDVMEDYDVEFYSQLGDIFSAPNGQELGRTQVAAYSKLVKYAIEGYYEEQGEDVEVPLRTIKSWLIKNMEMLEPIAEELQKSMPQAPNEEEANKKKGQGKPKSQAGKKSKA